MFTAWLKHSAPSSPRSFRRASWASDFLFQAHVDLIETGCLCPASQGPGLIHRESQVSSELGRHSSASGGFQPHAHMLA